MAIADDLVGHAHIAYLGDPFEQYCGLNGKPLIGGWIEVYHAGTDTKYITMQNFDGAMNPFKVPLNADGRVVMLADPSLTYDMYVRNSYGDLVCSRLNVECTCPGNISISGADTRIKNTDGTLDVSLRTLGNNIREYTVNTHNKILDVQDPLYFVENSNTATVIGFSGDGSISISGKMDESKLEYNAYSEISAYNGSAFAGGQGGGAGDPAVNDLVHSNSATWNNVSAKLDTTAFSTVSGSFLTAHQDLSDYSTTAELAAKLDTSAFSDVSGTFLTAHQDLSQYAKTEDLTAYQEKGDYYSASNPSGFITNDDITGKLDTTAFSDVSGSFLTAHQSLDGYLQDVQHDNTLSGNGTSASPLGVIVSALYDAGISNIVMTASLPAEPDATTLYMIPEA